MNFGMMQEQGGRLHPLPEKKIQLSPPDVANEDYPSVDVL